MIVIGMGELVKIHIHTNNPDLVIGSSLKLGELSNIKIDNMKIQHRETIMSKEDEGKNNIQPFEDEEENQKSIGVIAVSQGEGLNEIFKSMGADIIEGGQSMNPSTENILSAVEKKHIMMLLFYRTIKI